MFLLISAIFMEWYFMRALSSAAWYRPRSFVAYAADSCLITASRCLCSTPTYNGLCRSAARDRIASLVCAKEPSQKAFRRWSSAVCARPASTLRRKALMSLPPNWAMSWSNSVWCDCASASKLFSRRFAWRLSRTDSRFRFRSSSPSSRARKPSRSRSALLTASSAALTCAFNASAFSTRTRITSSVFSSSDRESTSRCKDRTSASRVSVSRRKASASWARSFRSCCARPPADSAVARARVAASVHSRSSACRLASSESTSPRRATCDCSSCNRPFCSAS
mmetsp:Transcript_91784/g.264082  ORF Transcript_91784/g.264082 Transcript_91784/m.264082 type:complete len:280 (-) Transcript_91784:1008-1847(-)